MKYLTALLFVSTLLLSSSHAGQTAECFARFVPERNDDFAWENDKVAFRVYGPHYRGKGVDSGIDCWLKRVEYPIIDKWYAANLKGISYHEDHGEGYDPYHVGSSRGCGGLGLWIDGKLVPTKTFTKWEVLEQRGSRAAFVLTYEWEHGGNQYREEKQITIEAGDQLFQVQSTFHKNGELAVGLPIAVGLTTHDGKARASADLQEGWMACWEKIDGYGLGTGVVMAPERISDYQLVQSKRKDESHALLITETDARGRVDYAAGYGWEKAGDIKTADEWIGHLRAWNGGDASDSIFAPDSILSIMRRVNDHALAHPYRKTDRNWIRATWYSGVMEAYRATGDKRYLDQARAWAEKHEWQIGQEKSGFNRLFCAMTWLELYQLDPSPEKIAPTIKALAADLPWSPSVGKIWYGHAPHQTNSEHIYADGYYASCVFTMLHKATGEQKYLDFLHDAFWKGVETILDKEEDLYYRDPGYIGKKSPHGRKIIWSRGNGWVFAGLPLLLRDLPKDDPHYERYIDLFRRMAASLAARQQDDGFWRSNLDDPQHYTMPESSGTAFFLHGFGWGIREGVLDRETYLPVVIRGWQALVSAVHPDGLLGWVQPVDSQPRPSHPRSTHEYATGLFLSAGSQVYALVRDGVITADEIQAALPGQSQMLPPAALKDEALTSREHPLHTQINDFLKNQKDRDDQQFTVTGFKKRDYLDVIASQVEAMRHYQNAEGRIIDPVEKTEKYYTTPCYAHSVAVLAKAGYPVDNDLLESGMKALDVSLADMAAAKAPGGHGDFFTWPIVFACELFGESAPEARRREWRRLLGQIDPVRAYRVYKKPLAPSDHRGFYKTYHSHFANNWNLVNVAGEWGRVKHGLGDPWYVDYCMTMQLPNFTPHGMYNERGNPLPYDLFSRHYLAGMLARGYNSFLHTTYRDILWRGAWSSLFMQSPFGELPTGYRSSHHIWNEAQQALIFEIYASAYAKAGKAAEAGAFKRAAHLSLRSIKNWIRPDGSGFVVKNRYPIEARHGYERYTAHTCYNMLAMSMLAQAWQFADDNIVEEPAPADVGGFVTPIVTPFHKVFANAGGNYLEYDTTGDHKYNPTGILRIHLKDGHPQLGPSDGCAPYFSGKDALLAVGPAWRVNGKWTKLAELKGTTPEVTVLEETPQRVRFQVSYTGVSQTITIDPTGVTVEDDITVDGVDAIRVYYPMLVFDGKDQTEVAMDGNSVGLTLAGKNVKFSVIEPKGVTLQRGGKQLKHRNGVVDAVFAEAIGERLVYRITAK